MNKMNQKGFGAMEGLLVVIVVVLIGGIGWYVFSKSKTDKTPQTAQTITPDNQVSEQVIAEDYLNIPELGVKLKTKHANKLSYVVKAQSGTLARSDNQESDTVVVFSFKPEFVVADDCKPGVELYRLKSGANPSGDYFKQVGSRYYVFDGGPGNCSTDTYGDPADDVLKGEVLSDFKANNLEAI